MSAKNTSTAAQPIMRRALGERWECLGDVVRRHYAVTPGKNEAVVMKGRMSVRHSRMAYPFLLIGRLVGALIAKRGNDVPVCVRNWCTTVSPAMHWHRTFGFQDAPAVFSSRMEYVRDDEIVEYVGFGLGVRMRVSERDGALVFTSCGYRWNLGVLRLYMPDWLFLGKAEIREIPLGENRFRVDFAMRHPLMGETFGYSGEFILDRESTP